MIYSVIQNIVHVTAFCLELEWRFSDTVYTYRVWCVRLLPASSWYILGLPTEWMARLRWPSISWSHTECFIGTKTVTHLNNNRLNSTATSYH